MPKKEYDWSQGPAELAPHSVAKHTILREYIERYVAILTRSGTVPNLRISLIDGFAGGGEYVVRGQGGKIHEGSPLILINAVRTAVARIDAERTKPINVDADFLFVEKNHAAFEHLNHALAKNFDKSFLDKQVRCINGPFEDHVWSIVDGLKPTGGRRPRPIFVLDQYGYSDVPIDMIAKIMQELPSAEIFLTLAVEHISAYAGSLGDALTRLRSSLHIDPKIDAFVNGRKDFEELDSFSEQDRNEIMFYVQWLLHEAFAQHAGAKCYTPFFITSRGSHRSYWFLHLANAARANDVVKELHWGVENHFQHHGRAGTKMLVLGFDPAKPSKKQLSFDFGISARECTVDALVEELPALLQEKYCDGVTVDDLYASICNDTPASKEILKQSIDELCSAREIEKVGAAGEERRLSTRVGNADIIQLATQGRLISIPHMRGPRLPRPPRKR